MISESDDSGRTAAGGYRTAGWSDALRTALYPLLGLFDDPRITEIEANGFDDVWVKGSPWRGHRRTNVSWPSQEDFRLACIRAGEVIGRQVSEASPLCNARLPGGERVNIAVPPACARIALTIRLFPTETLTFDKLQAFGSVDANVRTMLESLVLARKSILIAGGTGSGKTSLLNAMSQVIPAHERIVTIEDARELQIQQPNWVAMETVEPIQESGTRVTIGDLVKNALRQTPDRIVVGEVRGEEAFYLLRALSTGHGGGLGTIHADDGEDALHQLQLLTQMADVGGLTAATVAAMVGRAVDVVVYQGYFEEENARRVSEILEIEKPGVDVGQGGGVAYLYRRLLDWSETEGRWRYTQRPSQSLMRSLQRKGLPWPTVSSEAPDVRG
jgi:pilus assembly protein CpaF